MKTGKFLEWTRASYYIMRLIIIEKEVNKRRKIFYKILFFPFTIEKTRLYINNLDKVGGENAFPIDKRGECGIESIHRIKNERYYYEIRIKRHYCRGTQLHHQPY